MRGICVTGTPQNSYLHLTEDSGYLCIEARVNGKLLLAGYGIIVVILIVRYWRHKHG